MSSGSRAPLSAFGAPVAVIAFVACSPAATRPSGVGEPVDHPAADALAASPSAAASPRSSSSPPPPCTRDEGCGFDPSIGRCTTDARANPQPAIVDQGIGCYCEASRCETLRVWPVPCESDASCAVRLAPRPHPVAASSSDPHERGRRCADFAFSTTCERTNICTMHRLVCR